MKADELMIGDLVHYIGDDHTNDVNIRVREIHEGSVYSKFEANEFYYNELESIPLTPEILEKNGFKRSNQYNYIYKDDYCKVRVSVVPKIKIDNIDLGEPAANVSIEGALFDINMMMTSIHELQQALRLCGIEKEIIL